MSEYFWVSVHLFFFSFFVKRTRCISSRPSPNCGSGYKNPMFIGLALMVIHSWEDYGKISAIVPFRSVDDFPPSELCELHELASAARPHQP
jgi:hypothetical protein